MNFDFSALNFETIDSNINAYPDMFLNQNGVTFTKKVLEDLGYPAFVLCLLDAKARVFAIRSCKSNEPKGFKFSCCMLTKGNITIFLSSIFDRYMSVGSPALSAAASIFAYDWRNRTVNCIPVDNHEAHRQYRSRVGLHQQQRPGS